MGLAMELLPVTDQPDPTSRAGMESDEGMESNEKGHSPKRPYYEAYGPHGDEEEDSDDEEPPVSQPQKKKRKQAAKAPESYSKYIVPIKNAEGVTSDINVETTPKEHEKVLRLLNLLDTSGSHTREQVICVNLYCKQQLKKYKPIGNLCKCCRVPKKSGACNKSDAYRAELKKQADVQKQKNAQEREDDKQIRAYQAGMLKEENKAKRAEANKRKRDVLEACDGMSAGEVQEAVAMFKASNPVKDFDGRIV